MYYRVDRRIFEPEDEMGLNKDWALSEDWHASTVLRDWNGLLIRTQEKINQDYPNGLSDYGIKTLSDPSEWKYAFREIDIQEAIPEDYFLEEIRRMFYPRIELSRFNTLFCTKDLEAAQEFKRKSKPDGFVYELEGECVFRGDMNLLGKAGGIKTRLTEAAHKYWSGEASNDPFWEYLLKAPAKVIRRIE